MIFINDKKVHLATICAPRLSTWQFSMHITLKWVHGTLLAVACIHPEALVKEAMQFVATPKKEVCMYMQI